MKKYSENDQKVGQIMQIKVNSTKISEVLARVEGLISDSVKFYIVTPNPELILASETNNKLKEALNAADISIPDGVGLKIADPNLNIIKGRELFLDLIKLAVKNNWKVFLLGGMGDESEASLKKLQITYPKLKIKSARGPMLDNNSNPITETDKKVEIEVMDQINQFKPDFLFVAFGNPKQEIWIHDNLSKLSIGGAMAVGGTFRYIAGTSKLPPKWMARSGLEWLWRLITEPIRFSRVFRAVIVFPIRVFLDRVRL